MRKVLSFVLVLSLILGSFSFAFGADAKTDGFSDVAGLECEGAVKVLAELGVVNGYTDGTYRPEKVVTRAEMAKPVSYTHLDVYKRQAPGWSFWTPAPALYSS